MTACLEDAYDVRSSTQFYSNTVGAGADMPMSFENNISISCGKVV